MSVELVVATTQEQITELAGIPFIESEQRTRGEMIVVRAGAFMDSPSTPAVVIHPIDAAALRIAWLTDRKMSDVDVMTEAVLSVIARRATVNARRAVRRIDAKVAEGAARTEAQIAGYLHPREHLVVSDRMRGITECLECDYTVTDEARWRFGVVIP